ncbi:MAG TPA: hypothetical protein VGF94_03155 [Kofleriaceae bacterium]|jgi:hypothetical protein
MRNNWRGLVIIGLVACGPGGRSGGGGDAAGAHIEIAPADQTVMIMNGVAQTESYTATLVAADGGRSDVTATAVFAVSNGAAGTWSGPALSVTGGAAGPVQVTATDQGVNGSTGLTIFVTSERDDGTGVPPNAGGLFDGATAGGAAPAIAYPADKILVPPNLGTFDVHWTDSSNNLIEVRMHDQYTDLRIYKASTGAAYTTFTYDEFGTLASARDELTLTVSGLNTASPTTKGVAAPQTVDVTNETVAGGVYYWTTEPTQGVLRYDMSAPNTPPASFFSGANPQPTSCVGCHALSHDGSKIALTLDSGDGRGTILDIADGSVLVPYNTNPQYWNFATFDADGNEVITLSSGQMVLRNTMGGAIVASVPNSSGMEATHPELSPDGTRLANVETNSVYYDFQVNNGSIVTRTFDASTNTFGAIQTIVPNASGASNYYPSWSPDGQWLLFTRTIGNSYADTSAETWVVKADGTQPPIQMMLADTPTPSIENSWPRWAPFQQSFGPNSEPLYYLTFSTARPFGVRSTGGVQIWMSPFFPDRAAQGMDPSGPAFRMPFQDITTSNHIAQWTQQVVVVQ